MLQAGNPPPAEEAGQKAEPGQIHPRLVRVLDAEVRVKVVDLEVADQTAADTAPAQKDRQGEAPRGPKCAERSPGTRGSIKKCATVDCFDFEVRKRRGLVGFEFLSLSSCFLYRRSERV